jgi:8-oxo-dGTP diphosphatase
MLIQVAAAIILSEGKVFLAKRAEYLHQGGLWEFPGGKCEASESPEQALIRELQEEIAITPKNPVLFESVTHDYGDKKVSLSFFLVELFDGVAQGNEGQKVAWFDLSELAELDFPEANRQVVNRLLAR